MFSNIFDHKLTDTEEESEAVWSVEACEGYKVTEKLDKVCS